jgi:hypothetical protein
MFALRIFNINTLGPRHILRLGSAWFIKMALR